MNFKETIKLMFINNINYTYVLSFKAGYISNPIKVIIDSCVHSRSSDHIVRIIRFSEHSPTTVWTYDECTDYRGTHSTIGRVPGQLDQRTTRVTLYWETIGKSSLVSTTSLYTYRIGVPLFTVKQVNSYQRVFIFSRY